MFGFFKRKKAAPSAPPDDKAVEPSSSDETPFVEQRSDAALEPAPAIDPSPTPAEIAASLDPSEAAKVALDAASAFQETRAQEREPSTSSDQGSTASSGEGSNVSLGASNANRSNDEFVVDAEAQMPKGWMARLRGGLSKTSNSITGLFVRARVDDALLEELEEALLVADAGLDATEALLARLKRRVREERIVVPARVREVLRELLVEHLRPLERPFVLDAGRPLVVMIAGVNGAGKTTSIGKLAHHFQRHQCSLLLAAGDTFRAAAREQLAEWGMRNGVSVIAQESGDPAAVVFDAVQAAKARNIDIVIADTAGRLPTQLHLMDELRKIKRVTGKAMGGAPHEVLLVIDGNTGQNALAQVKAFDDALGLTGLIVTKLDGTAKGGVLAAIASAGQGEPKPGRLSRAVPVYFIGVGEQLDDLQPFSARQFADALLS